MKTTTVDTAERGRSPLGSHIRFLIDGPHGNMIGPELSQRGTSFRQFDHAGLGGGGGHWRRLPRRLVLLIPARHTANGGHQGQDEQQKTHASRHHPAQCHGNPPTAHSNRASAME